MKVLQVAAEIFPLLKTGGLADVLGALPQALIAQGHDVRLVLPGMPAIADAVLHAKKLVSVGPAFGAARVDVLEAQMPFSHVPVYLVDAPYLYRRGGGPYQAQDGSEWSDNLQRFGLLGWVAAHLAAGELDPDWTPDLVHAHDWHAGMTCAYMAKHPGTVAKSIYTVHNLAYQGLFPPSEFPQLGLPQRFMTPEALEYHGQLSFMKAGLRYAHRVTTVSPTYAREIATHEFGAGLDGVIRSRGADVSGILNGVDPEVWDPSVDTAIAERYDSLAVDGKARCKTALQAHFRLAIEPEAPLFTLVSRLTSQKGLDLVLGAMPALLNQGAQFVVQGTGDPALEDAFRRAGAEHPSRVAVYIGYDEGQAHRLIAGADVILVPSRFEPCGLTQLYGLRYGTVPVVRRVGGLADTVVDATEATLANDTATGFSFDHATTTSLEQACQRALALFREPRRWHAVMQRGMAQDFSWANAAIAYGELYRSLAG